MHLTTHYPKQNNKMFEFAIIKIIGAYHLELMIYFIELKDS